MNGLLAFLRIRTPIGGLEVSDSALRYADLGGGTWRFASVRLPPGIVEDGTIKDRAQFVAALRTLRAQITGFLKGRRPTNVVVSLSSINIYSQVFNLPIIQGENLARAVELNMQMISPDDITKTYSGWQIVGEDEKAVRLEVLGAFIARAVVDDMRSALAEGGFVVYALESRALSLARTVRMLEASFDAEKPAIVVNLDSSGMQFLIVRKGQLYFEYFTSWRDVETEGHQISQTIFEGVVRRNLHQVLNFYQAHWTDKIYEIVLSATGLKDEVTNIITKNFEFPVRDAALTLGQSTGPDWYIALGGGLRGSMPRRDDRDLSLLGTSAQEEFHRHQLAQFMRFWRVAVPVTLSIVVIAFAATNMFLQRTEDDVMMKFAQANVNVEQQQAINELKVRIQRFNATIARVNEFVAAYPLGANVFSDIVDAFAQSGVSVNRFDFTDFGATIKASAEASNDTQVKALKRSLSSNPRFSGIDIPLTEITYLSDKVTFSVIFSLAAPNTE